MLTKSQIIAFDTLDKFLRLKRCGIKSIGNIRIRSSPLLVGPSGCGKNHVVSELVKMYELPYIMISSKLWAPRGSREKSTTLKEIERFVDKNHEGVVLVDEINKLDECFTRQEYACSIILEHMALLDADEKLPFPSKTRDKFRKNFLLIGAGAWQNIHREKSEIGFLCEAGRTRSYAEKIQQCPGIPEELLLRFNADLICIPHPTEQEIVQILSRSKLLPRKGSKQREIVIKRVLESSCPMRTIEALATKFAFRRLNKFEREILDAENILHKSVNPCDYEDDDDMDVF